MNIQTPVVFGKNERIPDFADHLLARGLFDQTELAETSSADSLDSGSTLRRLWKTTDLSSHEFANEVAAFFNLRKLTLMELADLRSLADRFTPRFLREASLFPFETEDGAFALAAGDPSDAPALQAVEIVFGAPFELVTASFEDIATVLGDKLDADDATAAGGPAREVGGADENVDNLRDLASGAPVVRAVNDLVEKGSRTARERHPHRTVPRRAQRAPAGGRSSAERSRAGARAAAGARVARQDNCRPQHRGTASSPGWRGAATGGADRY